MSKLSEQFKKNSIGVKMATIAVLALLLLIPAFMISSLIHERQSRKNEVISEISSKWGNVQVITGPFLSVPYKSHYRNKDGAKKSIIEYYHILPDKLNFTTDLSSTVRYRGLYETVLYSGNIHISAKYLPIKVKNREISREILWDEIYLSLGINDLKGITEQIHILVNNKKYLMEPGLIHEDLADSGVSTTLHNFNISRPIEIEFDVQLNGSRYIQFIPLGKETTSEIKSDWNTPSFSGSFLPVDHTINKDGFLAKWKILHLNRNYPQQWAADQYDVENSAFGVDLIILADVYQKSMRTSKYAILFIGLTFCAFFFSEIFNKQRIHPVQYLFIGFAIVIFYILLIAIAEHIGFGYAYLLASSAIIALITFYSVPMLKNKKVSAIIFSLMAILYGLLYIILQLEDMALLLGSIAIFGVLAAIMYITRKIDWYLINLDEK
ncbi:MAG: cell envelope integrity protein CreD [Leptospirales bacterium]